MKSFFNVLDSNIHSISECQQKQEEKNQWENNYLHLILLVLWLGLCIRTLDI